MNVSLESVLKKHGIEITPDFSVGKQRHGSQWLFCHETEVGGKKIQFAYFGDYKTDLAEEWQGSPSPLSDEEKKVFKKYIDQTSKARIEMQETLWAEMQLEANRFLREECTDRSEAPPYLVRKGFDKLSPGQLVHVNKHGSHVLIVPMRDIDGTLWNYQRIYPEKLSKGDKFFLEGAKIAGTFFTFGEFNDQTEVVYIAEGIATARSIHDAFLGNATVLAAFNAGNLEHVGRAVRSRSSKVRIVFCADNDAFTRIRGSEVNVGLLKARKAAAENQGEVVYPRFRDADLDSKPTDFNDLHRLQGLDIVHSQVKHPEKWKDPNEIEPIVCKGKPSEESISALLVDLFKGRILREENDLFLYKGTHWELCGTNQIIGLRNMIRATAPGKLSSRDVDSALKTFKDRIEHVPGGVSLFTPNPATANFLNGTLHILRNSDASFRYEFRPHAKHDFITSVLPFDFLPDDPNVNAEFERMLKRIWQDDVGQDSKILRYGEDLGAALCGLFPNISIYLGKPGTGKSTLLLIASKLVAEQNLCMVDPTAFEGFNMESMPGKLVNIVTDLNTSKPISDELVKTITDRVKFRVRRKGLKDVYAFIPAIHLWACNSLPRSFEGASGAMERRVTIIETNKFQPVGLYDKEYHVHVWEQNPQGIINFAVKGLLRLMANKGHYTKPESAKAKMDQWRRDSDVVGVFLHEISEGLIADKNREVTAHPEARIERKMLWEIFLTWHKEERNTAPRIGKIKFFDQLYSKGLMVIQDDNGIRFFKGVGCEVLDKAQF